MPRKARTEETNGEESAIRKVRRRRNDPSDHPIDGDMRKDVVKNKAKGFEYLWLTPEDAMTWRQWGAVKEERREGSAQPAFDMGDESDTDFKVGGLTLYKVPAAVAAKRHGTAVAECNQIMKTIKREARRSPGGEYVERVV